MEEDGNQGEVGVLSIQCKKDMVYIYSGENKERVGIKWGNLAGIQ